MSASRHHQSAVRVMCAGLALTVVATALPFVNRAGSSGLTGHLRTGYPAYSMERIHAAAETYLIYLSIIGVLGVACWLGTMWAVHARKAWARGVATTTFVAATVIAVADLVVRDTSGDTGLPSLVGWTGVLPCLAGLVAVALLWRRS
jgi:hypothetical protein